MQEDGKVKRYREMALIALAVNATVFALVLGAAYVYRGSFPYLPASVSSINADGNGSVAADDREGMVVSVIENANPAVVSVVVTKDVPVLERYYEEFNPFGDFFEGFQIPRVRERGSETLEVGGGSGFIVTADGLVVTNRHVVADEEATYTVVTNTGSVHDTEVIARDPVLDIAILKISEGGTFPHLSFGDSDSLKLGETVIAIGNALAEFRNSVSVGVVSGLARSIVAGDARGLFERLDEVIQTDAAINPGNSGGPLLNLGGGVIGVNVATALGSENIGFALPANVVKEIVESVREHGEIIRPYIGVRTVLVTPELEKELNLSRDYGALVAEGADGGEPAVLPGSPAAVAGIMEGDIILSIDGVEIRDGKMLGTEVRKKQVDDVVALVIFRDGEELTRTIKLEKMPE